MLVDIVDISQILNSIQSYFHPYDLVNTLKYTTTNNSLFLWSMIKKRAA
jgi:hypothetical protein